MKLRFTAGYPYQSEIRGPLLLSVARATLDASGIRSEIITVKGVERVRAWAQGYGMVLDTFGDLETVINGGIISQ
tara:strand:- start:1517 stop:1741 length:225 start_codon:yes stop_codon:yes gene_type:complete